MRSSVLAALDVVVDGTGDSRAADREADPLWPHDNDCHDLGHAMSFDDDAPSRCAAPLSAGARFRIGRRWLSLGGALSRWPPRSFVLRGFVTGLGRAR